MDCPPAPHVMPGAVRRRARFVPALRAAAGAALVLASVSGWSATYFIRPDGGSIDQCDGLADRARDGSGSCAWVHPFIALPPGGQARISGGDTLIIAAGDYRMGIGAPGSDACHPAYSWDCHMPPLPGGPDAARPTRLLGAGHDAGCQAPPELWGAERAGMVLNLEGTRHAELACLEITDRSGCIEFHCHGGGCAGMVDACKRDQPPFGDWAPVGLYAANAHDIAVRDVDIHGLASRGVLAGGLSDWTIERVRINANGWAGWDGDIGKHSANRGRLHFRDVEIAYNGCAQSWPAGDISGCWAQGAGGYGDGLGTARSGGEWVFERVHIHHNTSDGLDLLYLDPGAKVHIDSSLFEGNAGNQVKIASSAVITNSVVIGNCQWFVGQGNFAPSDHCRAAGDAVFLGLGPQVRSAMINNTITGEGNCLVSSSGDSGGQILMSSNLFVGQPARGRSRHSCLFYSDQSDADIEWRSNLVSGAWRGGCVSGRRCIEQAGIASAAIDAFDPTPAADSPVVGQAGADARIEFDFLGRRRPAPGQGRSVGALEPPPDGAAGQTFHDRSGRHRPRLRPAPRPGDDRADRR